MTEITINKLTLGTKDLAELLGVEERTILNRRSANPESLPPALDLPQRDPVWLTEDVLRWLRERSPYHQAAAPKRGPGRPPKPYRMD